MQVILFNFAPLTRPGETRQLLWVCIAWDVVRHVGCYAARGFK